MGKTGYNKVGLYNGYDKNNKERAALDYYATNPKEVSNILRKMEIDLNDKIILEPCAGGGHMVEGILEYCEEKNMRPKLLIKTDIQDRGCPGCETGEQYDFLSDEYPYNEVDILIMNPPYSCLEGFLIRALEIAPIVIVLGRSQMLETRSRYDNIYKDNPPSMIYQYVDRIDCWKNGIKPARPGAQSYSWVIWDASQNGTSFDWIERVN